ncbi:MAG TPA: DUF2071 domain-containing protein [Bryobacteraceae bacterium]|jgi:hypothetical protein
MHFLYRLKRHPIPMAADFRHSLVITYAFDAAVLEPLLPPGLALDTWGGFGFLAIALVDTCAMRPAGLPRAAGVDAHLAGYRIFTRLRGAESLRGLRILRSETDRFAIAYVGNLLTHYQYHLSRISVDEDQGLRWRIDSEGADLDVRADLDSTPARPPEESPFEDWRQARRFAGPLPYTFDYEPETDSIIRIEGVRRNWNPRPVTVEVRRCGFLEQGPFANARPRLANAFYVSSIAYEWKRGEVAQCC